MGVNLMDGTNRNEVIELARETVAEQLETASRFAPLFDELPPGDADAVRRPDRPSTEWPSLEELSLRVARAAAS
jgi:hypothetical protein